MRKNVVLETLRRPLLAPLIVLALLGAGCSGSAPESTSLPEPTRVVDDADATAQESVGVPRSELPGPEQNKDHWHSVYGVYSCDLAGQDAEGYLPAFQSWQDDTGIHSHGDGLIHIHPFFRLASGENARFEHWFREMNIQVSPESITVNNQFDDPVTLVAGEECADGTGPAEIRILQWEEPFDPASPPPPDNVFTQDLGSVRFVADAEVFVIAYASESEFADLPAPPADRFEALGNTSGTIEWNRVQRRTPEPGEDPTFFVNEQIDFVTPTYSAEELSEEFLYDVPLAVLTEAGQAALARVAEQLVATGATVEIRVYATRPAGSPYSASDISLGQAIAVQDFLIARRVSATQLVPLAYGSDRARFNERVEFVLIESP